jgi:hypothetical protein
VEGNRRAISPPSNELAEEGGLIARRF